MTQRMLPAAILVIACMWRDRSVSRDEFDHEWNYPCNALVAGPRRQRPEESGRPTGKGILEATRLSAGMDFLYELFI